MNDDALLTVREVADILRLTPAAVYRAAKQGRLPCIVVMKGVRRDTIRFRRSIIMGLLSPEGAVIDHT